MSGEQRTEPGESNTGLRMGDAAIADADRVIADLTGPDTGGHNGIRRLNDAAFLGERYAGALVADWKAMRHALLAARDALIHRPVDSELFRLVISEVTALVGDGEGD